MNLNIELTYSKYFMRALYVAYLSKTLLNRTFLRGGATDLDRLRVPR
jgi:hypothetical protein